MLSIDFLKPPLQLNIAGMESIKYQSQDFFNELSGIFDRYVLFEEGEPYLNLSKEMRENVSETIMRYTGINMSILNGTGVISTLGVDSGYFYPNSLLNKKGLDGVYSKDITSVSKAFKYIKSNVLKGTVDTEMGKIFGDFSKIAFSCWINPELYRYVSIKEMEKRNCTLGQGLAAATIHECGHVFNSFLYVTKTTIDSSLIGYAIQQITNNELLPVKRVTFINDTLKELGSDIKVNEKDSDKISDNDLILFFTKAVNNRDLRRTLSLGTQERSSEVLADLYAVKFGCDLALVTSLPRIINIKTMGFFKTTIFATLLIMSGSTPLTFIPVSFIYAIYLLTVLGKLVPGDTYDTPYRRLKTILVNNATRLKNDKNIPAKEKMDLLERSKQIESIVEENKHFLEGTFVQRLLGYLQSGSDFKAQQFEHYTEELVGTTLALYENHF